MPKWLDKWDGGRSFETAEGETRWVLDKTHLGVRYNVTLSVKTIDDAIGELALWRRDPVKWQADQNPTPVPAKARATLTPKLIGAFLEYQAKNQITLRYRQNLHTYLTAWGLKFGERDLSTIKFVEIREALDQWPTAGKNRITALKSFASWLRTEKGVLTPDKDPTLQLVIPVSRPEKALRVKGYTLDHVAAIYPYLEQQDVRDVFRLRAFTGLHETEVDRTARGQCEVRDVVGGEHIAGTLTFRHKSGQVHVQSVDALTLAAVRRLVARGKPVDNKRQVHALTVASAKADRPRVLPGEIRHSFVTWAGESGELVRFKGTGVSLEDISIVIGHASRKTTNTYYNGVAVPPLIRIPLVLTHPEDPV